MAELFERVHRLWRLKRNHHHVDALLVDDGETMELQIRHNGEVVDARRWASRELAVAAAGEKRAELERAGWISHW